MTFSNILLASHGTPGAKAAACLAVELGGAAGAQCRIHQLYVIPELWSGILGDDWLNNGVSRDRFKNHIESELGQEADQHAEWVQEMVEGKGLAYDSTFIYGDPEKCLLRLCESHSFDLIVAGAPRPKGEPGLRSRMLTDKVMRQLAIPLFVAPYPKGTSE